MAEHRTLRAQEWALITPHDTNTIDPMPEALEVTAAGSLTIEDRNGNEISWSSVPVGRLPFRPVRVKATGTTATVYALY